MAAAPRKSLMRNLGAFVGHIINGVKADTERESHELRRDVEEDVRDTPDGQVTLRRTTIEEIEISRERR